MLRTRVQELEKKVAASLRYIDSLQNAVITLEKATLQLHESKEPNTDRRKQAHTLAWRQEQSKRMKARWAAKKGV